MIRNLRGLFRLKGQDRAVVLQALGLFVVVRTAHRFVHYQRLQLFLSNLPASRPSRVLDDETTTSAQHIARIVDKVAHHDSHDPTCLERSLVLWALLRRKGIQSDIWVGASKVAGEFVAHAWVEHGDQVLNDTADVRERFVPLSRISNLELMSET